MPDGINEDTDLDFDDIFGEEGFGNDDENEEDAYQEDNQFKDIFERAKKEAEEAVVAALVNEDTNSGVYKGLQKVLSKRDRELNDLKKANQELSRFIQEYVSSNANHSTEVEFIKQILPEMLDDDSKKIYSDKREQFVQSKRLQQLEEQQRRQQMPRQQPEQSNGEDPFAAYKKMAADQMRSIAEVAGIDPDDKRLDFGDEETENLATRLGKLKESLARIKKEDEDLSSVRRKPRPETRTRNESFNGDTAYGQDIIRRGLKDMLEGIKEI